MYEVIFLSPERSTQYLDSGEIGGEEIQMNSRMYVATDAVINSPMY